MAEERCYLAEERRYMMQRPRATHTLCADQFIYSLYTGPFERMITQNQNKISWKNLPSCRSVKTSRKQPWWQEGSQIRMVGREKPCICATKDRPKSLKTKISRILHYVFLLFFNTNNRLADSRQQNMLLVTYTMIYLFLILYLTILYF